MTGTTRSVASRVGHLTEYMRLQGGILLEPGISLLADVNRIGVWYTVCGNRVVVVKRKAKRWTSLPLIRMQHLLV
jgi:hypothetical protein